MNVHATVQPWPVVPKLPAREVDPIVLQIVEGTLNSIEAEIEYAIERTARSPMIREAHDYRVGLFDRYCRKLTGRSYSAMRRAPIRQACTSLSRSAASMSGTRVLRLTMVKTASLRTPAL